LPDTKRTDIVHGIVVDLALFDRDRLHGGCLTDDTISAVITVPDDGTFCSI
jgi:hypothetical protein